MLIDFLHPSLPWVHNDMEGMINQKWAISVGVLCGGLPWEFAAYFQYIRSLSPEVTPNYSYLRQIFLDLFERNGFVRDDMYDWTIPMQQLNRESKVIMNDQ